MGAGRASACQQTTCKCVVSAPGPRQREKWESQNQMRTLYCLRLEGGAGGRAERKRRASGQAAHSGCAERNEGMRR